MSERIKNKTNKGKRGRKWEKRGNEKEKENRKNRKKSKRLRVAFKFNCLPIGLGTAVSCRLITFLLCNQESRFLLYLSFLLF